MTEILTKAKGITSAEDPSLPGVLLSLSKEISTLSVELERLKSLLREEARKSGVETNRVSFPVPGKGEVTVTFQKNRVLLEGAPRVLKSAIGQELFELLFEEKTVCTARREILSLIENLPKDLAQKVKASLRVSEETPRVGFVYYP